MTNTTLAFLGDRTTWQQAQIVLDETHGLWGGRRIAIRGDGVALVTQVELTQEDQTFQLNLGVERALRVFDVCAQNDVLAIAFPQHTPVPDELNTRLEITNHARQTRTVTYWANSPVNARFEEARTVFTAVADNMEQFQPIPVSQPDQPPAPPQTTPAAPAVASPERLLTAITDFFQSDNWTFEKVHDRPVLRLPFQGKNGKWNCFAQVRVGSSLEQFLFYSVLPLNVPEPMRQAIAEFVTRANYGMAIGNFELDFSDGEVRYKTSIDASDAELTHALIRPVVVTNCLMMDKYFAGFMSVIYANISPAVAIKQIEG
jgi:hypothetical protein